MNGKDFIKFKKNKLKLTELPELENSKREDLLIPNDYRGGNYNSKISKKISFLFNSIRTGLEVVKIKDLGEAFRDSEGNVSKLYFKIEDCNAKYAKVQFFIPPSDEYGGFGPGDHGIIDLKTFNSVYKSDEEILEIIKKEPEQFFFLPIKKFADKIFINKCLENVKKGLVKNIDSKSSSEDYLYATELLKCVKEHTNYCKEELIKDANKIVEEINKKEIYKEEINNFDFEA